MSDSDDDIPTLSAHTLAALQDFYNETRTGPAHGETPSDQFAVGAVEEDWVGLLDLLGLMLLKVDGATDTFVCVCRPADESVLVQ